MLKVLLAGFMGAALLAAAAPAEAHHSVNAQFDVTREFSSDAVLQKLENINPHTYWTFEIKDKAGAPKTWRFESVNPAALRRTGLKLKDDLKPGTPLKIYYNPARNESNMGLLRGLMINGKRLNFVADYMPPA